MRELRILVVTVVVLVTWLVGTALAMDIAKQIAAFEDGEIRFEFAAREGVYGDGENIVIYRDGGVTQFHGRYCSDDDYDWREDCEEGPVRVSLRVRNGKVDKVRIQVAGEWRKSRREVLDLGEVEPQAAADYLLDLARTARRSVAEEVIFPTTLARDVVIWPELLEIARDRELDEDIRSSAVFSLGQCVGDKVTDGLKKLVDDDDEDLQIRESAIFALHERDDRGSIDALTRVATNSRHPQLRRTALFWLAETEDPRVLDLFEEILTSP